ncbi:MAG: STAS domain-containing protein [Gaiellales bacterium]
MEVVMIPGIRTYRAGTGVWILALEGDHDVATAASVRAAVVKATAAGTGVVVDLSAVTFMDSSIVRTLAEVGGDRLAVVVQREGPAQRAAEVLGLGMVVPVYQSRIVACRECGPGSLLVKDA